MKTLLALLFILVGNIVIAQNKTLTVNDKQNIIDLGKYMQYYEDKSNIINIDQVKTANFQQNFKSFPQEILNLGANTSALWLKLELYSQTTDKYYLQIDNSYLDSVLFYFPDQEGTYKYKLTGKKLPIETEDIASTHCIIELPMLKNNQIQTFYLRLISNRFLHIEAKLLPQKSILNIISKRYIVELIFFGVIFLAIIHNFFMYLSVRDVSFLYYVIYTFFMGVNIFNTRGYLSLFFSDYREFISEYTYFISSFYTIFILFFTLNFLQVKHYSILFYRIFLFFLFLSFLRLFLTFIGYGTFFFNSGVVFFSINVLFYLISGIVVYFKGYKIAIYYLASWSLLGFFTIWAFLAYTDIFTFNSFSKYLNPLGITLETIVSSLGLAYRINVLKQENQETKQRNIDLIKTQKENLEGEVRKRTEELEIKNKEIETQNEGLSVRQKEIEVLKTDLENLVSQRTQELRDTLNNLAKQNQDLSQFSYIISHNLRAPVARILGLMNIFNYKDYNDDFNKQIINHLKQTTVDLDVVIRDLTQIISIRNDLSKVKEEINILDIINVQKFLLQSEIEKSKAVIDTELVSIKNIQSTKGYVQSILYNLLSNAIKYKNEKRSPIIKLRTEIINNFVCLSVQDNGLGIDLTTTDTYKIFGLYQRMHSHVEGKGLGLFLVKTQIESLGGKIEIESELGIGTTFKVYFPNVI